MSGAAQADGSARLAVFSSAIGLPSETFIARHMQLLLPGATAVVANRRAEGAPAFPGPQLVLADPAPPGARLADGARYLLGMSPDSPVRCRVRRFLEQHGVEVILSEYLNLSLRWLDMARRGGFRFFAHAHGYDISAKLRDPDMQRRYRQLDAADGIITMSEVSRRRLTAIGLDGGNIHVIPYGVDVPEEAPRRTPAGDTVRCLAVGRMTAKKDPLATLAAFSAASAACPALRLDFVGDGELMGAVRRFVGDHGLDARVELHGSRPNAFVRELMAKADLFLQHSRVDPVTGDEEGLPVAILEAMAAGVPVVSTRHSGIPEAVTGAEGCLVAEGDVEGMAAAIVRFATDEDARRRAGDAAWRRARTHYSWERERERLLQVLGLAPPVRGRTP